MNTLRILMISLIALAMFNLTFIAMLMGVGVSISYIFQFLWTGMLTNSSVHYILFVLGYFLFFEQAVSLTEDILRYILPSILSQEEIKSARQGGGHRQEENRGLKREDQVGSMTLLWYSALIGQCERLIKLYHITYDHGHHI